MLVDEFKEMPDKVALYHMKSNFEETSNRVNFLYKFEPGVAPQSFGIYVAKMAGINVSDTKILILIRPKF
jgi:DNA mismatch repair ATPase MutS